MAIFDKFKKRKKDKNEKQEELSGIEEQEVEKVENSDEQDISAASTADIAEIKADQDDDLAQSEKNKKSFFDKFKQGLARTRQNINEKLEVLIKSNHKLDEDFWEELEEILIQADVGVNTSVELVKNIRSSAKKQKITDSRDRKSVV